MKKFWVYIHTCTANGKRYVGTTTASKPERRWLKGNGYQNNNHFYRAILKYGWDNFEHEVFEVDSAEEMYRKEVELISFYHSNDPRYGYNNSSGGEKSALGCIRSEEMRRKMSEARKGKPRKPLSEEHKRHIAEARKGKHHSEEARKHMAEANRRKAKDPEIRRKISEALKGKPKPKIKISLPDGTIVEVSKHNLVRNYVNKDKEFQYVSE